MPSRERYKLNIALRSILCATLIAFSALAAILLVPTKRMADNQTAAKLETIVPTAFGDWSLDQHAPTIVINPLVAKQLAQLYSSTLTRTYRNSQGSAIMLSIAYGADQRYANQIHKPEVCYPSQGFQILDIEKSSLNTADKKIPTMRLTAIQGERTEPITYWILLGNKVVRGAVELNIARIGYGLQGVIPDGLLFRVSEVTNDVSKSFISQEDFIKELLESISPELRGALIGNRQTE